MEKIHATTVLGVLHNGMLALGADGQATMGNTVAKSNVKKVRALQGGKILVGFRRLDGRRVLAAGKI